jgi:uncharacterized membrane protein
MAEIFDKFFDLIFNKIPTFIAQTVFAVLTFPFGAYRSIMRLSLYARRSQIPTIVFLSLSFAFFMFIVGIGDPFGQKGSFNTADMLKHVTDISTNSENKQNVLYILLYALGLTTLVILCQVFIETILRDRFHYSKTVFRNLSNVALAIAIPWMFTALLLAMAMGALLLGNLYITPPTFPIWWWPIAFAIGATPMLIVAFRFERRWNRAGRRRRKVLRAVLLYASSAIVLAAMPAYLMFLNARMYVADKPVETAYAISCFNNAKTIYVTVAVENPTGKTEFIRDLYVLYDKAGHFLVLSSADIFQGLKADMAVKPHDTLRFRAVFSPREAVEVANCRIVRKRPKGDPTAAETQIFRD